MWLYCCVVVTIVRIHNCRTVIVSSLHVYVPNPFIVLCYCSNESYICSKRALSVPNTVSTTSCRVSISRLWICPPLLISLMKRRGWGWPREAWPVRNIGPSYRWGYMVGESFYVYQTVSNFLIPWLQQPSGNMDDSGFFSIQVSLGDSHFIVTQ